MAAPVALLASRLRPRWLAAGFALQMALSLGLAAMNHQHWDGLSRLCRVAAPCAGSHRVWVDDEWGLRYLHRARRRAAAHAQASPAPGRYRGHRANWDTAVEIHRAGHADHEDSGDPALRFRCGSSAWKPHSGYSTASRGFWPFGISAGVIDRVRAVAVGERHPTAGIPRDGCAASRRSDRQRHLAATIGCRASGVVVLKSPAVPPCRSRSHLSFPIRRRRAR